MTSAPDSAAPVRVRIAPSPTGDPHVGTAYIALFNYVFAKKHGGQFILRIEDTDQTRSHPESEKSILRALKWVGLNWDEGPDVGGPYGPYRQSERAELYRKSAQILIDRETAYRCFCTEARVDELRKQQKVAGGRLGYDRHCRSVSPQESAARAAAGEPFVVRLKMPTEGETVVNDLLRGEVRFENSLVDDQVLMKTDGFPTYHLANVVDDHEMKITHVIRAEEWLVSTPKHEALYNAFGWQIPTWVHMPLLRNPDKSKISKRKNPVSLDYYRDAGYLPEALLNFLGTMGWSISGDREKFDLEEMIRVFTFDRVSLGGPVFDLVKLRVLNSIYLRELDDQQFVDRLRTWRFSDEYLRSLVPLVRQRVELLSDFVGKTDFFFQGDVDHAAMGAALVPKKRTRVETIEVLKSITEWLDQQRDFSAHGLETDAKDFAEKVGWEPKEVSMLLRVGATARKATPPLFETLEVLGRDLVRKRIRECTEVLKRMPDAPASA